ncbi:MAG: dockerin type I domain-containing protein, partial [Acidobacteriota bacterium]
ALGQGDGTFSFRARTQAFGAVKEANAIGAGDFDGDGAVDLLVPGLRLSDVALLPSGLLRRGDTNGDGRVDGFDLAQLTRNWALVVGPGGFYLDINMDGTVDPVDLTLLASAFGMIF